MPIRFCRNVFLPYHFWVLLLNAWLLKMLPWKRFQNLLATINPCVKTLVETDLVFDITGGDSFSDIYGMRRLFLDFLRKSLVFQYCGKLIMLPQTYGPFSKRAARILARRVLNHATLVYSRERSGVNSVKNLLNTKNADGKIRCAPDVAFILDARRPKDSNVRSLERLKAENAALIGFNISGLLFHGGYTRDNMFNLKTDYRGLICSIIELLTGYSGTAILLVPHVFPPRGWEVESDLTACTEVYEQLTEEYPGRIFLSHCKYNHNESKYIIGLCDFFIGSRMHACIAALSQNIPTIGLAYSKKFNGVFEMLGAEQLVVDMRRTEIGEIKSTVAKTFEQREAIIRHLKAVIPRAQQQILNMFNDIS
jgi:colanic acid/amylovoran biosynthesis protein